MKILSKENLLILINNDNSKTYSLKDLEVLLNCYGDDYYADDNGVLVKVNGNINMTNLKTYWRL